MAFNFPDPAVSTTATNPVTGAKYQWRADPGKWVLTGGPAEAANPPVTISLLPPEGPQKGDLWIHEESLVEYAWDGTQWFEVGSSCGGDTEEEKEEKDLYFPFVNSFRLVAPDDYTGEEGTATILTNAYDAGDDSYLLTEDYIVGDYVQDKTAQNELFDSLDDNVLDFSESNPFGDAGVFA